MKKGLKEYDIDIFSLSNKTHAYDFDIEDSLFQNMPDSFLKHGKLSAKVILEKSETMIQASITIKGFVELTCDRSNELFQFAVDTTNKIIFKFGEDFVELTEDIIIIPRSLQRLNVAQYLYEFIVLSIPIKKIHPKLKKTDELDETKETSLIYTTSKQEEVEDKAEIDPRWASLANLKKEK